MGGIGTKPTSALRHGSSGYIHTRKLRDGLKQLFAMVSSKSEPFYFGCVYNPRGRFEYRPIPLHLPERGKSRMHIIRDMFGPGHSPLVSGAFFAWRIPALALVAGSSDPLVTIQILFQAKFCDHHHYLKDGHLSAPCAIRPVRSSAPSNMEIGVTVRFCYPPPASDQTPARFCRMRRDATITARRPEPNSHAADGSGTALSLTR